MKKTYIGQCEHICNCCITDDECLKRYFHITNPYTGDLEILIFCNDWIKLEAQKVKLNDSDDDYKFLGSNCGSRVVKKEILKHLNIVYNWQANYESKNISNYGMFVKICERPFVCTCIPLINLIENYKKNRTCRIRDMFIKGLRRFFSKIQYKKYKSRYEELIRDLNRIEKNRLLSNEESVLAIDELMVKTFEYIIKNKQL